MIRIPTIVWNLVIACVQWVAISSGYYLILFYVKYIGGNIFLINITSKTGVALSYLVSGMIMKVLGTKISFIIVHGCIIASVVPLMFIDPENSSNAVLLLVCINVFRAANAFGFTLVYYINFQLFPTLFFGTALMVTQIVS